MKFRKFASSIVRDKPDFQNSNKVSKRLANLPNVVNLASKHLWQNSFENITLAKRVKTSKWLICFWFRDYSYRPV